MTKTIVSFFLAVAGLGAWAQVSHDPHSLAQFTGKYQLDGIILQFAQRNNELILIVPGAPSQILDAVEKRKFRSRDFSDLELEFVETGQTITGVVSKEKGRTSMGKKIADKTDFTSEVMDTLLVHTYLTEHFRFMYSSADTTIIDSVSSRMERDYHRILADFQLKQLPAITVRIYPDLKSFHLGINLPAGPDEVLGTAFGKTDLRIVSPQNAGPQQWMMTYALPHEFTHCVHLNIKYAPNDPRWLWEGVAQYEAGWFFNPKDAGITSGKDFPAFQDLTNGLDYMLGYVIIEAIREQWGADAVLKLIKTRGDTQEALHVDQKQFEEKIVDFISGKYLTK